MKGWVKIQQCCKFRNEPVFRNPGASCRNYISDESDFLRQSFRRASFFPGWYCLVILLPRHYRLLLLRHCHLLLLRHCHFCLLLLLLPTHHKHFSQKSSICIVFCDFPLLWLPVIVCFVKWLIPNCIVKCSPSSFSQLALKPKGYDKFENVLTITTSGRIRCLIQ